jgi:mono/diheme cytochrome c family protein
MTMNLFRPRAPLFALLLSSLSLSGTASAQDYFTGHFTQKSGEAVFKNICQGCHMPDAMGATGAGTYPQLANNPHLVEPGYPVMMVMNGHKAMPSFGNDLDDTQIAHVVNYVRTHFGNHYTDAVTPAFVASARPAAMTKPAPKVTEHR